MFPARYLLQWGRDQLVAEIAAAVAAHAAEEDASMGPRPIGRGNRKTQMIVNLTPQLQWGRDQLVAEMTILVFDPNDQYGA